MNSTLEHVAPLPTELHSHGFVLRQIARKADVALYEQLNAKGRTVSFELILIRTCPARNVFGQACPAMEVYPSPSQWGRLAWSIAGDDARQRALARLDAQTGRRSPLRHQLVEKDGSEG